MSEWDSSESCNLELSGLARDAWCPQCKWLVSEHPNHPSNMGVEAAVRERNEKDPVHTPFARGMRGKRPLGPREEPCNLELSGLVRNATCPQCMYLASEHHNHPTNAHEPVAMAPVHPDTWRRFRGLTNDPVLRAVMAPVSHYRARAEKRQTTMQENSEKNSNTENDGGLHGGGAVARASFSLEPSEKDKAWRRDQFAMAALPAVLARFDLSSVHTFRGPATIGPAAIAYQVADAMVLASETAPD